MRNRDIVDLAINGIRSRKLRSGLTALGIIIGSAAFVALVTLGANIEQEILGQFNDFGADKITITPGVTTFEGGPPDFTDAGPAEQIRFDRADEQGLEGVPGVRAVHGLVTLRAVIDVRGETASLVVTGVEPADWVLVSEPEVAEGRMIRANDDRSVMIGDDLAYDEFPQAIGVNQQIGIDGTKYRVIGIVEDGGQSVYVTRDAAAELAGHDEITSFTVLKLEGADADEVAKDLETSLLRSRGLNPEDIDFTVITAEQLQEAIEEVSATVQAFLGSIAGISLLVGGIGIANTMFMTVMERSRQIGILKAVGMTREEVVRLFLFESALLGFLGGIFGSLLGAVAALGLRPPNTSDDFGTILFEPTIVLGMALFATLIGAIAGVIPAFRAATVPPMESLQGGG